MDYNLPKLYKDYGKYSNWRNMPLDIDGLKPVERRVLLSAFKIAKNKFVKSRQVDAYTIGHYHPHGECYGSIVQLVRQGFLEGQGNFGTNVGIEPIGPAAPRYTECKIMEKTVDMAFKYVDYVEWIVNEFGEKEPAFLPIMYPACLMGKDFTQGIGFGFKTYIPCYDTKDLQQRLLWLLGIRKRKPIIAPITSCVITSTPEEVEKLLTKGKGKISVEGVIIEQPRINTVVLKSWPPGKKFESLLGKFSKELAEGLIGFTDVSVTETEIKFQVLRERNRDKIYTEFVEKLKEAIKGFISFETILTNFDQTVITKSVDNMLIDTYNMFISINEKMLKNEMKKLNELITEYNILEKIKAPLAKCIGEGRELDFSLDVIKKSTGVDTETARFLINKYRINKLFSLNTDTTDLDNKIKGLLNHLNNLNNFVLEQYNGIG